jgi:hypothetical protein
LTKTNLTSFLFVSLTVATIGCGSSSSSGATGTGGSTTGTGGSTTGTGGSTTGTGGATGTGGNGGATGACNNLQLAGAPVTKTTNAGPAPAMTGGTVSLGTYMLTAMNKYNGTQGSNTHREIWTFTAGHVEAVTQDSDGGNVITHYSGTFTTSGNSVVITITCPAGAPAPLTLQYTATATDIKTLSEPTSSDQEVHTITKQP